MFADSIITALFSAVANGHFALDEPHYTGNKKRYVQECIASTYLPLVGAYVERFDKELAAYSRVPRALAMVNGTALLHADLQQVGVQATNEA